MARWRAVNGTSVPARRLLTEWGTPVHVQRQDEGEWADGASWSERLLDETYGSGYVRALVLRLERGGAAADSKTAVSAPSQCRPWVKSSARRRAVSVSGGSPAGMLRSQTPYYRWLERPMTDAVLAEAYRANALFDAHREDPEFGYRFLADAARDAGSVMADRTMCGVMAPSASVTVRTAWLATICSPTSGGPSILMYALVHRLWRAARRAAGITRRITPQWLRHFFASVGLAKGVPVTDMAVWLGHSDPRTTYQLLSACGR